VRLLAAGGTVLLGLLARTADAQSVESTQANAFVVNFGPMIGFVTAIYGRINPEFQMHRGRHYYSGHALNLGPAVTWWPNEGGFAFSISGRWQYDQQLVPGTLFYVSPYLGLELGLGLFDMYTGSDVRPRLLASPIGGIDLKLIVSRRLLLSFRPVGVTVPIMFFDADFGRPNFLRVDVWYDVAFSIGTTY